MQMCNKYSVSVSHGEEEEEEVKGEWCGGKDSVTMMLLMVLSPYDPGQWSPNLLSQQHFPEGFS